MMDRAWGDLPSKKDGVSGFSLHEAGEETGRLGIENGYEPIAEYLIHLDSGSRKKVDWV